MTELKLETDIGAPTENVFDLITDFGGQDRWLTRSSSFRGTTILSPGPVALGTRYRESEPFGVRNGTVTEFERPARVTFRHRLMKGDPRGSLELGDRPVPHAGTIDV